MDRLRRALALLGIVGALVLGVAFATSIADPVFVESIGRELIRREVEARVGRAVAAVDESVLADRARRMLKVESENSAQLRRIAEQMPDRISKVLAQVRDPACSCRRLLLEASDPRTVVEWGAASAARTAERLDALIRTRYLQTAAQLQREFRIFTGTTAAVFALLAIAALARPKANLHLLPAAVILLVTSGVAAYLYLFNQDWLHTVVFSDYLGFGYVAWLGVACACLFDIIFNRARLTVAALSVLAAPLATC